MLEILVNKKIVNLCYNMDLCECSFEAAVEKLNLTDDNFILHIPVQLYIEALKIISFYLTLIDSDKKAKDLIKVSKYMEPDGWIIEKGDTVLIGPGA